MRANKKGCQARIVLGEQLSKTWAQCKIRLSGTCCKDCSKLERCSTPCGELLDYYSFNKGTFDYSNFNCPYYLTGIEAIFKRLEPKERKEVDICHILKRKKG